LKRLMPMVFLFQKASSKLQALNATIQ